MTRAAFALAVLVLGLTGCSAAAAAPPASPEQPTITARAVGTVDGTPDVATVVLGVQTRGPSAQGALDDNTGRATALIDALKGRGVAPADLQTSQLSIYPTYDQSGVRITGYEVSNLVTATLRDVAAAGALIDAAGEAAGDAVRVQQLGFSIDDDSGLRAEARADAVRRAQTQARQLAEAAGVELGAVRSITEVPASTSIPYAATELRAATDAAAVPLQPGAQELTVTVEVVYGIGSSG